MKKSAGFTLIELVVVIVILGILSSVATLKYVSLQSDAYAAKVHDIKNAIVTTSRLVHYKASLAGKDGSSTAQTMILDGVNGDVSVIYGYPLATDLTRIMTINAIEGQTPNANAGVGGSQASAPYNYKLEGTNKIYIYPSARFDSDCHVSYELANPPIIKIGARTEC